MESSIHNISYKGKSSGHKAQETRHKEQGTRHREFRIGIEIGKPGYGY
jgi:hypothetical protein